MKVPRSALILGLLVSVLWSCGSANPVAAVLTNEQKIIGSWRTTASGTTVIDKFSADHSLLVIVDNVTYPGTWNFSGNVLTLALYDGTISPIDVTFAKDNQSFTGYVRLLRETHIYIKM